MKVENKIYQLIKTANTGMDILNDADTKEIYPLCINEINKSFGKYELRGNASDYPDVFWNLTFNTTIKNIVYKWINKHCPKAWYKMMYSSTEEQNKFMNEQINKL
tara:strand:- start:1040 stop:1354 length:315 start_codon:yes stop_codon:yes gene_type:complete